MVDRYLPALEAFTLTDPEQEAVAAALATGDPWAFDPGAAQSEAIASVKVKIRNYHLARHGNKCCYCRINLFGGGPFMTDREHVLPKSVANYRPLSYTMWNLGIACKRCNMEYKKNKVDFVVTADNPALLNSGANYRFIHPNFDLYSEHLSRSAMEADEAVLVKYTVLTSSPKGTYTYDYFNLRGLEIDSFDQAQGIERAEELGVFALEARELAETYGQ